MDAAFDDAPDLGAFLRDELPRTGRGVLVCNPIPEAEALDGASLRAWIARAEGEATERGVGGRDVTPFVLGRLHELSSGSTLRANIALVRANAALAADLAVAIDAGAPA